MTVKEAKSIPYPDQLYPIYWRNQDGKRWVKRSEIINYFTDTWHTAVGLWSDFKLFGLPHGGGPMGERPMVIQAIRIVEEEKNLYELREAEEREKKRKLKHGGS